MTVGYYKNYLYTHRYKLNSEKKKKKKVPVHGFAPETGSDSPIGLDRDRGRDIRFINFVDFGIPYRKTNQMALLPGMVPKCKLRVVELMIHITSVCELSTFLFLLLFPLAVHC